MSEPRQPEEVYADDLARKQRALDNRTAAPLGPESIAYWRREINGRSAEPMEWPDEDVMRLVRRFLATLDAARTPEPDALREAIDALPRWTRGMESVGGEWVRLDAVRALAAGVQPVPSEPDERAYLRTILRNERIVFANIARAVKERTPESALAHIERMALASIGDIDGMLAAPVPTDTPGAAE